MRVSKSAEGAPNQSARDVWGTPWQTGKEALQPSPRTSGSAHNPRGCGQKLRKLSRECARSRSSPPPRGAGHQVPSAGLDSRRTRSASLAAGSRAAVRLGLTASLLQPITVRAGLVEAELASEGGTRAWPAPGVRCYLIPSLPCCPCWAARLCSRPSPVPRAVAGWPASHPCRPGGRSRGKYRPA